MTVVDFDAVRAARGRGAAKPHTVTLNGSTSLRQDDFYCSCGAMIFVLGATGARCVVCDRVHAYFTAPRR